MNTFMWNIYQNWLKSVFKEKRYGREEFGKRDLALFSFWWRYPNGARSSFVTWKIILIFIKIQDQEIWVERYLFVRKIPINKIYQEKNEALIGKNPFLKEKLNRNFGDKIFEELIHQNLSYSIWSSKIIFAKLESLRSLLDFWFWLKRQKIYHFYEEAFWGSKFSMEINFEKFL